jgi:DNA-directed RNA polymerase subunit K/omega
MDSKQVEAETIKPVLGADEEVAEGKLDNLEPEKDDENKDEEFSYESHRSPFPEGEF